MRPLPNSFPSYFNTYIKLVPENNILEALTVHGKNAENFLGRISEDRSLYQYAENKWTVKEILQHMIDAERIFQYRALCIARKETAILPYFNENLYAANSRANKRPWKELMQEFFDIRKGSVHLFKSFDNDALEQWGKISDYQMSVLAIGYTIAGHATHHLNIIRERYFDI